MVTARWRWTWLVALTCAGLAALAPSFGRAASLVSITSGPAEGETVASNSATFTFQSSSQATFKCTLDGGAAESCDSGRITYTALANGQHAFDVIATTTGPGVVSGSETRNWVVAVVPQATLTSEPPNPSESPDATFEFTSDQSDSTFECSLDGASPAACTSPITYHDLSEQSHVFTVRAVSPDAGSGPPVEYRWEVKAPPPATVETSIAAGPPDPSASPDATFSFASNVAGATFHCSLDGAAAKPCSSPITYSGLASGKHTFRVTASTDNGVDESPAEYSWTVAVPQALETTITNKPSNPSTSESATFEFTSNRSDATFECSLDGAGFTACSSPVTYERLSGGDHSFEVRAVRGGVLDTSPARYTWSVEASSSSSGTPTWVWILVAVLAVALIAAGVYYLIMRRRRQARTAWQAAAVVVPPPERCHGDGEYVLRRDCRLRPARRQVETVALRTTGPGGEIRRETSGEIADTLNAAVEAWRLRRGRETVHGIVSPAATRLIRDAEVWQEAGPGERIAVTARLSGGALDCEFKRFKCVAEGQHRVWRATDTWRATVDDEPEEVVTELHAAPDGMAGQSESLGRALLKFVEQVDVLDGTDPSEAPTALSH
jgi:hypothetical protein